MDEMPPAGQPLLKADKMPFSESRRPRAAIALLVAVFAAHVIQSVRLFPTPRAFFDNDHPVILVDHALHLYHGALGSRFLLDHGTTWGYDPFFMAGYPETPVWDSSSNLSILFQALAGGGYHPRAYNIGLLACSIVALASIPAGAAATGARATGKSALASTTGLALLPLRLARNVLEERPVRIRHGVGRRRAADRPAVALRAPTRRRPLGGRGRDGRGAFVHARHGSDPGLGRGIRVHARLGPSPFLAAVRGARRGGFDRRRWSTSSGWCRSGRSAASDRPRSFFMAPTSGWFLVRKYLSADIDSRLGLLILVLGVAGLVAWLKEGRRSRPRPSAGPRWPSWRWRSSAASGA